MLSLGALWRIWLGVLISQAKTKILWGVKMLNIKRKIGKKEEMREHM